VDRFGDRGELDVCFDHRIGSDVIEVDVE